MQFNSQLQAHRQQQLQMSGQLLRTQQGVVDTPANGRSSQPGTMYVNDFFTPSTMAEAFDPVQNPHGIQVARAARQQSFQGRIEGTSQHGSAYDQGVQTSQGQLRGENLDQRNARMAIQSYTANSAAGLLDSQSRYLDGLTQRGARNSAANISMGTSQAALTRELYSEASMAWSPQQGMPPELRQQANTTLRNMATAYGLDVSRLTNSDPQIHGPERQRLQQRLLDHVGQTLQRDPNVARERREWASSVNRFESGNNSVVISSGNEGAHIERMQQSNGNRPLRASGNASTNVLENNQVTSVGATRWTQTRNGPVERRADYSSDSQGVDIYAAGSLDVSGGSRANIHGTSFAAPRVAATMAELHRQNPNMSSAQIEALMKERLTHQLPSGGQNLPVLDFQRTSDFLAHSPTRR